MNVGAVVFFGLFVVGFIVVSSFASILYLRRYRVYDEGDGFEKDDESIDRIRKQQYCNLEVANLSLQHADDESTPENIILTPKLGTSHQDIHLVPEFTKNENSFYLRVVGTVYTGERNVPTNPSTYLKVDDELQVKISDDPSLKPLIFLPVKYKGMKTFMISYEGAKQPHFPKADIGNGVKIQKGRLQGLEEDDYHLFNASLTPLN